MSFYNDYEAERTFEISITEAFANPEDKATS